MKECNRHAGSNFKAVKVLPAAMGIGLLLSVSGLNMESYAELYSSRADHTDNWMKDADAGITVTRGRATYNINYTTPMYIGDSIRADLRQVSVTGRICFPQEESMTGNAVASVDEYVAIEDGRLISAVVGDDGSARFLLQNENVDTSADSIANCSLQEYTTQEKNTTIHYKALQYADGTVINQRSGKNEMLNFHREIRDQEKAVADGKKKARDWFQENQTTVDLGNYEECCAPAYYDVIPKNGARNAHIVRELVPLLDGNKVVVAIVREDGTITVEEVMSQDNGVISYTMPGQSCVVHLLISADELSLKRIQSNRTKDTVNGSKGSPTTSGQGGSAASNIGFTENAQSGAQIVVELLQATVNGMLLTNADGSVSGNRIAQIVDDVRVKTQSMGEMPVVTAAIGESGSVRALLKTPDCTIEKVSLGEKEEASVQNTIRYSDGTVILQRSGKKELEGFNATVLEYERSFHNGKMTLAEGFSRMTGTGIPLAEYKKCSVPVYYEVYPAGSGGSYTVTEQAPVTAGMKVLVLTTDRSGQSGIQEIQAEENGVIRYQLPARNCMVHLMVPDKEQGHTGLGLKDSAKDLKENSTQGYDSSVYAVDENIKKISGAAEGAALSLTIHDKNVQTILSQRAGNYTNGNSVAAIIDKPEVGLGQGGTGRWVSAAISKAGTARILIAGAGTSAETRTVTSGSKSLALDGVGYSDGGFVCQKGGSYELDGFKKEVRDLEKKVQDDKIKKAEAYNDKTDMDLFMYKPLGGSVVYEVQPGSRSAEGYVQYEQTVIQPGETVYILLIDMAGETSVQSAQVGVDGVISYRLPGKSCIVHLFGRR